MGSKMMGKFYLAVVQSVLLYGSETWVLIDNMRRMLEGLHNLCARQMTRRLIHLDLEKEGERGHQVEVPQMEPRLQSPLSLV
jgi:hypothetical protein